MHTRTRTHTHSHTRTHTLTHEVITTEGATCAGSGGRSPAVRRTTQKLPAKCFLIVIFRVFLQLFSMLPHPNYNYYMPLPQPQPKLRPPQLLLQLFLLTPNCNFASLEVARQRRQRERGGRKKYRANLEKLEVCAFCFR